MTSRGETIEGMDDGAQWVKVEFYARLPDRQVMVDVDVAETGATLMRAFGFTYIDGLTVYVAPKPAGPRQCRERRLRSALRSGR